jgi:hypothetical protein
MEERGWWMDTMTLLPALARSRSADTTDCACTTTKGKTMSLELCSTIHACSAVLRLPLAMGRWGFDYKSPQKAVVIVPRLPCN